MAEDPDPERVKERARHCRQEQTELDQTEAMPGEQKYPTTGEELAAEYADQPLDLPNETEGLGSVFDRLEDERFKSVEDARKALHAAITGPAGSAAEYNEERDRRELNDAAQEDTTDSGASDMQCPSDVLSFAVRRTETLTSFVGKSALPDLN